ncbi:hypothetical protein Golob_012838 [Gossypium lobatum]|uniref:DUF4283 domain-containing protein n=1 Tax=Gossypium lobatum TaxID=34289 RepID=A0A7J8LMN9_9ROSI|nr:hypothetical protein [Gossypium lobatum]
MANLNLDEGEEEAWIFKEETGLAKSTFEYCIMGCFLMASVVHFQAMRNTMANLRRLLGGITILDLGEKRYLFKFYNPLDLDRVINGTPWTFNNHLLVFNLLKEDNDLLQVALSIAKQFRNFIGEFVGYDAKQSNWGYKSYLRIRVKMDIRKPLKRQKKIMLTLTKFTLARFQYERLSLLCFLCGCLGHRDNFYHVQLTTDGKDRVRLGFVLPCVGKEGNY